MVVVLVIALAAGASAQEFVKGFTAKGAKIGPNISNFSNTGGIFTTRTGLGLGVFATYSLTPNFAIQPELLYMQKGTAWGFFIDVDWSANYLELPVLAKVTVWTKKKFQPNIFAGPAMALLLSSNIKIEDDGETWLDADVKDGLKSADLGFVLGGGFGLQFSSFALTFDVRYTWGLVDFLDAEKINRLAYPDDPDEYVLREDPDSQNENLSILFGVSF